MRHRGGASHLSVSRANETCDLMSRPSVSIVSVVSGSYINVKPSASSRTMGRTANRHRMTSSGFSRGETNFCGGHEAQIREVSLQLNAPHSEVLGQGRRTIEMKKWLHEARHLVRDVTSEMSSWAFQNVYL